MPCLYPAPSLDPEVLYPYIEKNLEELYAEESNPVANLANTAATLGFYVPEINWAGFYLVTGARRDSSDQPVELVLGPFWGKPAVTRIAIGSGVCGAAAERCETIVVEDVHRFPGHIACDIASNSEIVIPLIRDGVLLGVLDIDSPEIGRFTQKDRAALERIAARIVQLPHMETWISTLR